MAKFQPGVSGNPNGRPKGTAGGRIQALAALDEMLAKKKNRKTLVQALEQDFIENPVRFFKAIVMPLLPKESKLSFDHEGVVAWRSLLEGADSRNDAEIAKDGTAYGGDDAEGEARLEPGVPE